MVPECAPIGEELHARLELLVLDSDGGDPPHAVGVGEQGEEDLALDTLWDESLFHIGVNTSRAMALKTCGNSRW